jgi:hypothetical protein
MCDIPSITIERPIAAGSADSFSCQKFQLTTTTLNRWMKANS